MLNLPPDELRATLRSCLNVTRWIDEVGAAAPFETPEALFSAAKGAATPLSPSEIDEAMADHPRIGERREGSGAAELFSRSEQESLGAGDENVDAAIAAGNAAYERRFERVFLIRAAGRSRSEILTELNRRLTLPEPQEHEIVGSELRDIALRRLATIVGGPEA